VSLGVAVVGLGVGSAHARAFAALEGCELRWLYDLDRDRSQALAAELDGVRAAASLDELLADPEVGAVSIASHDDAHFEQALAVLEAGKHVFCEKPLCRTVGEARALRDARTAAGVVLASNLVLRSAPLYRWLRAQRERGAFGQVYAFDGDYLYGRLGKITDGWRKDVVDYSVMLGGGVHLVDLMLWITAERPVRVTATGNRISTEGTEFRYLDFAAASFTFPSGLVGRVTANFGSVTSHQHVVRVFGTEAAFVYDDRGPRLFESRDPGARPSPVELDPLPRTKAELVPAFVEAVSNGNGSREAEHELDLICVCAAVDRALAEGGPVDVEYV
jgi:predicted dehydrogenase